MMTNLTVSEKKILNKMANELYLRDFDDLDFEEQDELYCEMEEGYR